MKKRTYTIECPYVWEYDEILKIYPNLSKYTTKKFPIGQPDKVHYAMTIEIFDNQIIELCNEFPCKSLVIDFKEDLFERFYYPKIIIYDNYIE